MRFCLAFALLLFALPAQGQNNPNLSGFTPTAKAIIEYDGAATAPTITENPLGWGAPQKYRIEILPGTDRWVFPVTDLAHCNAVLTANGDTPTNNRYTRMQQAYDTMLAATSDTADPRNSYTVRCEDGWP